MGKIDPNDPKYNSTTRHPSCTEGEKLLAAVGFERFSSAKGNPCVMVRFVCVVDANDGENPDESDVGAEVDDMFTLTDKAMFRIAQLARAIGYHESFDPSDDDDLTKMLNAGYFWGHIELETYEGKERPKIRDYMAADAIAFQEDPEAFAAEIGDGEARFTEYMTWRASNPRGQKRTGGGGSGRSGGGTGTSSGYGNTDIPF